MLGVPRKRHIVVEADGTERVVWDETEAEWALRCAMVAGLPERL